MIAETCEKAIYEQVSVLEIRMPHELEEQVFGSIAVTGFVDDAYEGVQALVRNLHDARDMGAKR